MAEGGIQLRVLNPDDAAAYREVRLSTLQSDPNAYITTAEEFAARPRASVAERLGPSETVVTLGGFVAGELVGILTLVRLERPGLDHRAEVMGVGVLPRARGQGCGDILMRGALAQARTWSGVSSLHLAVMETQHAARRLYERHGFAVWGTQPDAVRRDGQVLSEHWLWRPLDQT
ncbi:GNAT family N-acetyltransferase [Deinococcus hohokamensis]|uniref:GNAT family N-acetyltransferase n=1 Tax=Deinococcus hohokamensis TaxID=309883 RepID=A0ABV9I8T9_9DEIO